MGNITQNQSKNLIEAVKSGVGLAGIHGGLGDAFRGNLDFEWMVGGHFVSHPYIGEYKVRLRDSSSPITEGIPPVFSYQSEQYYLLVDPAVHILAETDYVYEERTCVMPVAWIRSWGKGRVFYSALGHSAEELSKHPEALRLTIQGTLWTLSR